MFKTLFVALVVGIFMVPAISLAQFKAEDFELTLSGTGSSDKDFRGNVIGVDVGLGYFLTKEIEVGLRQNFGYVSDTNNSSWMGVTRVFADYNIDLDRLVPFVGASAGYQYGDDVTGAWVGGPEAGVKFFLNSTTFAFGKIAYDFPLAESFDDGGFVYSIGLGVKL